MRTLSKIAQLICDLACSLLYAISVGAVLAIFTSAYTQRLGAAGIGALAGLIVTGAVLGLITWRKYRRLFSFAESAP